MSANRALIIDRSHDFRDLARRVLKTMKIQADCVDSAKAGLQSLADREPSIVVLAVEQPKKRGFEVFTQIKNMTRKVPIVISTSTVPMEDMLLHQKLRLHADAYLDKRGLDEAQLIRMLNGLLGLRMDPPEINSVAREAQQMKRRDQAEADASREGQKAENDIAATLAALESLDDGAQETVKPEEAPPSPAVEDRETTRLRRQVESLRAEIETAKRAAGSSPFSDEYLKLSEKAADADRKMGRLRSENERLRLDNRQRVEEHEASERKLTAAARKLVEEGRALTEAVGRADKLDERLRASEEKQREASARVEDLEARLAASEQEHERTVKAMRDEYAAAVATMREGLDKSHQYALKQARAEYEQTRLDELAKLRSEHDEETARASASHQQELGRLRLEHEQAMVRLRAEHGKALERKDREMTVALGKAAEDRRQEAKSAEQDRVTQLDCAEKKRRSDIAELTARNRSELGKAVEQVRAELIDELETLRRTKREADELAHEQAVKSAEAYDALLREKQETQKLRKQLVEEIERLREQHARELKLIEQEQARALESLAARLDAGQARDQTDPGMLSELLESVQTLDDAGGEPSPD